MGQEDPTNWCVIVGEKDKFTWVVGSVARAYLSLEIGRMQISLYRKDPGYKKTFAALLTDDDS